ncbi:hypothetical protein CHELA40_11753 [Chelatococcus asaccharovorans]|nr:hypothetical protein CHELA40_11753 [Chelatococcus asaccharovorans]CAH1684135.1 hypothetical protein CHELA17_63848 [Chelatococcus asaccharovorans]
MLAGYFSAGNAALSRCARPGVLTNSGFTTPLSGQVRAECLDARLFTSLRLDRARPWRGGQKRQHASLVGRHPA